MAAPNPQRIVYQGKQLPKVFIAYAHKPTVYEKPIRPENVDDDPAVWRRYENEVVRLGRNAEIEVKVQESMVKAFADFLSTQSITVVYDLLVRDTGVANIMRWCEAQINDSDYLILVITPSLCPFLGTNPPPEQEEEPLFSSLYLYNLITSRPKRKDGTPLEIIPLFLSNAKNLDHVPTNLRGGSIYEVWDNEYKLPLSEDLKRLLCRLRDEDRYEPPPPQNQIIIQPKRPRYGPKQPCTMTTRQQYSSNPPPLSNHPKYHHRLDMKDLSKLAVNEAFSQHWKQIAGHLGLSGAEIEQCEGNGGSDMNEACMEMLKMAAQRNGQTYLTMAALSEAISESGYHFLFNSLESVISV